MTSILHYRDPIAYRSDCMSTSTYHSPHMDHSKRSPPYDGHSSGSEAKQSASGLKKRPSRAGTRSVTTLTAAQLERKRANDREAQRAIRQRTKDHIDTLERQVRDLTAQLEGSSSTKMMDLIRRNDELVQENALLRTRLSHSLSGLAVSEQQTGAPSPTDRIQMLSHQPRRGSTGTTRSMHSVTEIATPVSQSGHWQQQQHAYAHHGSSPHGDAPSNMGDVSAPHHEAVRWSPHPSHPSHSQHHPVSMSVQDPSAHSVEAPGLSYPSPYGMESNARAMSYPLENAPLVTSQPIQMSGYGTPTSHPSPHSSEYQRHMSVPMHHQSTPVQGPPQHSQHHTSASYTSYPVAPQQNYASQGSHSSEMPLMHAPHHQPQMMNEQGQHIMYHMQPNMKVEH
ncbi:hypothetical protein ACN47E_002231 [Coniothyrium glycines]